MILRGLTFVIILFSKVVDCNPDCLEPDIRVIGRWKNGNYYKGVVESITNVISVLFDNGNRLSYNLHDRYGILEDRIPDKSEIHWGDPVIVHRPHSFAYKPGHIREIAGGRYMVWYDDGSYIYQTKSDIRVFNKSLVCNEPAYLGCFRDQVPRYLTVFIPTKPATVGACVDTCNAQGFSIAALRNSDLCFCGNAYNKGYQTDHKKCDMPCFDNPFEMCGGVGTFSQYWTGIVGDQPAHLPGGLLAHTALHMDPYGFRPSYTTVIRKQSIPRYGKLPWGNIFEARKRAQTPVSLADSSPWRWNALTSTWVRADGKQFRWNKNKLSGSNMVTSAPKTSTVKYSWYEKTRFPESKTAIRPVVTTSQPLIKGFHTLPASYHYKTKQGYWKSTTSSGQDSHQYRPWPTQTKPNKTIAPYTSAEFTRKFTPQLVLEKLADRMSHVKWSQLSNFKDAFKILPPPPAHFRYLGCYADDYQRDLPYLVPVFPLTTRSCVLKCREMRYSVAGIQRSSLCFCGNSYSRYGRVREDECNMKCTSRPQDTCGGVLRNSLYFTGVGSAWPVNQAVEKKPSPVFYGPKVQAQKTTTIKVPGKLTSVTYSKVPVPKSKHKLNKSSNSRGAKGKGKTSNNKTKSKNKTKTRNKITSLPKHDHSDMDDFRVESIKVKLNFSELKKALQTMSPEIVRRLQKDLEKINKLEKQSHPIQKKKKVKVELNKNGEGGSKPNGGKSSSNYSKEMEKIRKKLNKVSVNRLSANNMREILKIMKIPESTWKAKSKVIHRKKKLPKHLSSKASSSKNDDERFAHEEIESYSKISFDFPWKKFTKNIHNKGMHNKNLKKSITAVTKQKFVHKAKSKNFKSHKPKIKFVDHKSGGKKSGKIKKLVKPVSKAIKPVTKLIKQDAITDGIFLKTKSRVKVKPHKKETSQITYKSNTTKRVSKSGNLPKTNITAVELKEIPKVKQKDETDMSDTFEDALVSHPVNATSNDTKSNTENTLDNKDGNLAVSDLNLKKKNNQEKLPINEARNDTKKEKNERLHAVVVVDAKQGSTLKIKTGKEKGGTSKNKAIHISIITKTDQDKGKDKSEPSIKSISNNTQKADEEVKSRADKRGKNMTTQINPTDKKQNVIASVYETNSKLNSTIKQQPVSSNNTKKMEKIGNKSHTKKKTNDRVNAKHEEPVEEVKNVKSESLLSRDDEETEKKREKAEKSSIDDKIAVNPEHQEPVKPEKSDKQAVATGNSDNSDNGVIYLGNTTPADLEENKELEAALAQPTDTQEAEPASGSGLRTTTDWNSKNSEQKLMNFQEKLSNSPMFKSIESHNENNKSSGKPIDKMTSENKLSLQADLGSQTNQNLNNADQDLQETSGSFEVVSSKTNDNTADNISIKKEQANPNRDEIKSASTQREKAVKNQSYSGEDHNEDNDNTSLTDKYLVSGSGVPEDISGDAIGNYVYFGKGENKENLAMIRQDDLERLLQQREMKNATKRSNALNPLKLNTSENENGPSGTEALSPGVAVLNSSVDNSKIYAKSFIPTAPVYKIIRIPNISMLRKSKFKKIMKHVISKKKNKPVKDIKATKLKNKTTPSKDDIHYYHNVKGVRVHKKGITFTITKKQDTNIQSGKINQIIQRFHKNVSKNSNDKKRGVHHISERRKKLKKESTSKDKKRETLESENGDTDSDSKRFRDDGARNRLISKDMI